MILATINESIDTSTWTAIAMTSDQDCDDFAVQARTAVDVLISSDSAGATYWTLKANSSMSLNEALGQGSYFFYAKALVSSTTLEVQPLRRHRGK